MKFLARVPLAACLVILSGCGGKTPDAAVSPRAGVVFMGDSIFSRWDLNGSFPGKGFIDGGIEGQNTSQILSRLPAAISGASVCTGIDGSLKCQTIKPPSTIVIFAGWNNLFQGTDPQLAIDDIARMTQLCISSGVRPVILTIYHFDPAYTGGSQFNAPADEINQGIRGIGDNVTQITLVDTEQVFASQSGYTVDGVHPAAAGYSQMQVALDLFL